MYNKVRTVSVSVPPVIAAANPFIVVDEGDNVDLSCVVLDGKPKPSVAWLKNGQVLSETNHIIRQSQGMVRISDIQEKHEGEYTCLASNVGGNATYIVHIDVQGMLYTSVANNIYRVVSTALMFQVCYTNLDLPYEYQNINKLKFYKNFRRYTLQTTLIYS